MPRPDVAGSRSFQRLPPPSWRWGLERRACSADRGASPCRPIARNAVPVDTELVIAVDVSKLDGPGGSRNCSREATSPASLARIHVGRQRRHSRQGGRDIFRMGRPLRPEISMPVAADSTRPESADAVANEIARAPYRPPPRTRSTARSSSRGRCSDASATRHRRVIDVSGDGVNNMGPPVTLMRDDVLAAGITINGLPIMLNATITSACWHAVRAPRTSIYGDCVIGGPGAFVIGSRSAASSRCDPTKLVEIAGRTPQRRIVPAQAKVPRVFCS